MLDEPILDDNLPIETVTEKMPSLNHSYICLQIIKQLLQNETIAPLPELTLDILGGVTPDISVFPKEKIHPNFFNDVVKFSQLPPLAIEIISPSQNIQMMLEKARSLIHAGINTVWIVEPFGKNVFISTASDEKLIHNGIAKAGNIEVDFTQVFL
jgi:Uma2 family endonuclease